MPHSLLPSLTWLRAFETSARRLRFTRAAAELRLTQLAVSQQVRSLEACLGQDLIAEFTRGAGRNGKTVIMQVKIEEA